MAWLYHIWSDLHLLKCLVTRISKGVPANQKVKGRMEIKTNKVSSIEGMLNVGPDNILT